MEKKKLKKVAIVLGLIGGILMLRNRHLHDEVVGLKRENENLRDLNCGLQRSVESQAFGLGKLYERKFRDY